MMLNVFILKRFNSQQPDRIQWAAEPLTIDHYTLHSPFLHFYEFMLLIIRFISQPAVLEATDDHLRATQGC